MTDVPYTQLHDTLTGGSGNDKMSGGGGRDTFLFDGGWSKGRITGFNENQDKLNFRDAWVE